MAHTRSLPTAAAITAVAAAAAIILSSGHSPFASGPAADGQQVPIAADPTAAPTELAVVATDPPAPVSRPTAPPANHASSRGPQATPRITSGGGSSNPTPHPTPRPTPRPTPTGAPTPEPTDPPRSQPTPAPTRQTGSLSVTANGGNPQLSWSTCTSASFAAYAVVRSLDSEIHYPAEDLDTLVATITNPNTTHLTDSGAPSGVRVWYRVWCVSNGGGESRTIWTTPTVSVTP